MYKQTIANCRNRATRRKPPSYPPTQGAKISIWQRLLTKDASASSLSTDRHKCAIAYIFVVLVGFCVLIVGAMALHLHHTERHAMSMQEQVERGLLRANQLERIKSVHLENVISHLDHERAAHTSPVPPVLVTCNTTKGMLEIEVFRHWSPNGADQFLNLVKDGWFTDMAFFRAVPDVLVQFGINTNQSMRERWGKRHINDDPSLLIPFERGTLSYAGHGPNSRKNQFFFSLLATPFVPTSPWETPIGHVKETSMSVLSEIYTGYGEIPPKGSGPDPLKLQQLGNSYILEQFPNLDFIKTCKLPSRDKGKGVKKIYIWKKVDGFINAGGDLLEGYLDISSAKLTCETFEDRCKGFSFRGELNDPNRSARIFLKDKADVVVKEHKWTTYLKEEVSVCDAYEMVDGFITVGGDVQQGKKMTLADAKAKCIELSACAGFTHRGEPTDTETAEIFFKSKTEVMNVAAGGKWTTYLLNRTCLAPKLTGEEDVIAASLGRADAKKRAAQDGVCNYAVRLANADKDGVGAGHLGMSSRSYPDDGRIILGKDNASPQHRWCISKGKSDWYHFTLVIGSRHVYLNAPPLGMEVNLASSDDGSGGQRWIISQSSNGFYQIKSYGGVSGDRKYLGMRKTGRRETEAFVELFRLDGEHHVQHWDIPGLQLQASALASAAPTVVACETTKGLLDLEIFQRWSPNGADHFLALVRDGWFTDVALFRAVPDFVVQFGINTDRMKQKKWQSRAILDDPPAHIPFDRGVLSFAGGGKHSRTTQLFFAYSNTGPSAGLGRQPWETPIGRIAGYSLNVLGNFYTGYGEMAPRGTGPDPHQIQQLGNDYVRAEFPKIDFIKSCKAVNRDDDSHTSATRGAPDDIIPTPSRKPGTLHTLSYASNGGKDDRLCRSIESSIRNKFDLVVLGWGSDWKGVSGKLQTVLNYASHLPNDDLILFVDAFDGLFVQDEEQVARKFQSMKANIVFSAECSCWPHVLVDNGKACLSDYPTSPTPYRYLNSAAWIGYASDVREMLTETIKEVSAKNSNAVEQRVFADLYINRRFGIQLDFYSMIFQSMATTFQPPLRECDPSSHTGLIKRAGERRAIFRNRLTNQDPIIFHFNGGGHPEHYWLQRFLEFDGKMWYRQNAAKARLIENELVSIPSGTDKGAKLSFREMCRASKVPQDELRTE